MKYNQKYNPEKEKTEKVYLTPAERAHIIQKGLDISEESFADNTEKEQFFKTEEYFPRIGSRRLIDIV